jgi:hypothetical protein
MTKDECEQVMMTASSLFTKWKLNSNQKMALLALKTSDDLHKFENNPSIMCLDDEQVLRLSLLMNIHAALRTYFNNPDNVYGFMSLNNFNPPFNGRKPIDFAVSDLSSLKRTCEVIIAMIDW